MCSELSMDPTRPLGIHSGGGSYILYTSLGWVCVYSTLESLIKSKCLDGIVELNHFDWPLFFACLVELRQINRNVHFLGWNQLSGSAGEYHIDRSGYMIHFRQMQLYYYYNDSI